MQYQGDIAEDMDLHFDVDVEVSCAHGKRHAHNGDGWLTHCRDVVVLHDGQAWGDVKTVELRPGGSKQQVTAANRDGRVVLQGLLRTPCAPWPRVR